MIQVTSQSLIYDLPS